MSPHFVAAVYACIGVLIAALLLPPSSRIPEAYRAYAIWFVTILTIFFVQDVAYALLLAFLAYAILAPAQPTARTAFFLVAAPTIPHFMTYLIPFPGINYLIAASSYKAASLAILIPIVFGLGAEQQRRVWTVTSISLAAFVVYTAIAGLFSLPFTSALRILTDQSLLILVPYLAVVWTLRSKEDLESMARALLLVTAILAGIELICTAKQWDIYKFLQPAGVFTIPDVRAGFLRMELTANTHSLGFQMVVGLFCMWGLRHVLGLRRLAFAVLCGLMGVGIYYTHSRGAMSALAVALITYGFFMTRTKSMRWILAMGFAVALFSVGIWLTFFATPEVDPYGGVTYRQQIITVGLEHLAEYPVFGDLMFEQNPRFETIRQGQGIIDITNFYLQMALPYGLFGLGLILIVILKPLATLSIQVLTSHVHDDAHQWRAIMASLTLGWCVLAATTSTVGLTLHLGLIIAGLAQAVSRRDFAWTAEASPTADRPSRRTLTARRAGRPQQGFMPGPAPQVSAPR
jgi:hypothetical protein